jgi:fibronectin-binding autotransporter adhesin
MINSGAVLLSNNNAAGLATNKIVVNASTGAALQLSGGVTIGNPLLLNNVANETTRSCINSGGALQSIAGSNTYSGLISTGNDTGVGALAGATLNITGGIDDTGGKQITFYGAGTINLNSAILNVAPFQVNKYGSGTTTMTVSPAVTFGASTGLGLQVNAGTFQFAGNAVLPSAAVGGLNVNPGATWRIRPSLSMAAASPILVTAEALQKSARQPCQRQSARRPSP